jgi:hypothetical protein
MADYGFVQPGNPLDGEGPLREADRLPPLEPAKLQVS